MLPRRRHRQFTRLDSLYGDDPHFDNVLLLMPMDGPQDGVVFKDYSKYNWTISVNGVGKTDRATWKRGISCAYFDKTSDWLTIANDDRFNLGTGLFTIEFWAYFIAHRGGTVYPTMVGRADTALANPRWNFACTPTGAPQFNTKDAAGNWTNCGPEGSDLSTGQWYHIALVRIGTEATDIKLFVDGTLAASSTSNPDCDARTGVTPPLMIGGVTEGSWVGTISGYIDDLRITKNVARYIDAFTPPASPYSLR